MGSNCVVMQEVGDTELFTLDPDFSGGRYALPDGKSAIRRADYYAWIFWRISRSGIGLQCTREELVECFVALEVRLG